MHIAQIFCRFLKFLNAFVKLGMSSRKLLIVVLGLEFAIDLFKLLTLLLWDLGLVDFRLHDQLLLFLFLQNTAIEDMIKLVLGGFEEVIGV